MIYLLVNHVAFAPGRSRARFRLPEAHLTDLRATAAAIAGVGGRLIVAAPRCGPNDASPAARSPSRQTEFSPDAEGFEFVPLPFYINLRQYWRARTGLETALRAIIPATDVVQMDYAGHPIMLAETAWPIAGEMGKPRVFVFDAHDPFPSMQADARRTANPVRRAARRKLMDRRIAFCRSAVAEASLVITHNDQTSRRFRTAWDERRCHELLPPPVLNDADVLSSTELETRLRARADRRKTLRLLCPTHGPAADPAIRALAHCRRLSVPVSLTIIVPGENSADLREMAGGLAMIEHVQFVEPSPDVAGALAGEHDVLLSTGPEGENGFDPRLLRAMGCGMAVVTYDDPATVRLLEQNAAAIIVPRGNVLLLAQAVIDLQQNRRRLIELAENAWRFAASRTLEAAHRRRAELAMALLGQTTPTAR